MNDFRYTRPEAFPPVIKNLVIINVLVFVAELVFRQDNLAEKLSLYPINTPFFKPYQVVTHMFAHSPEIIFHIIFNMFTLWMFGRVLENVWGGKRFLIFYLACGLGAAALHLTVEYFRIENLLHGAQANLEASGPIFIGGALGASGAIMVVMAAFAYLFPNTELYVMLIPVPIKAKWAIPGFAAIDLFSGFSHVKGDNIAHFAHLGGAITGFILVYIWNRTNRKTLY